MSPESSRLSGKVAIVTGGGSRADGIGTGRAAAILFARHGARVLVVDRDIQAALRTVDMIAEEGGVSAAFAADLTVPAEADAMVAECVRLWGALHILDNNIGIGGAGSVLEATPETWELVMNVNVQTMVNASRSAIPVITAAGGGSIVNISSISALRPRGLTPYSTSKGAVIALTQAMAIDHAASGIRVNCIAPGPIHTPMVGELSDQDRERRRNASPLLIEGTGWDVGYAALFLVSDEARYITGVVLPVDGGVTISSPAR